MVDTATVSRGQTGLGSARFGLVVLALAVFGAVTTEMLPVGLLPAISRQLGLTASVPGLLVSLYAVMVMLLSVPLTLATRRVPGKVLLLSTIGSYAVSSLICALAPNAGLLAAGRALGGLTHAIFFSVCIGYASRLVPASQTGRALALVSSGVAAGLILGAPLATVGRRPRMRVRLRGRVHPGRRLAGRPTEAVTEVSQFDAGRMLHQAQQIGARRCVRSADVVLRQASQLPVFDELGRLTGPMTPISLPSS